MGEMNLLPWREARERYQQALVRKIVTLAIISSTAIIATLYWEIVRREVEAREQVESLQEEVKHYEKSPLNPVQQISTQEVFQMVSDEKNIMQNLLLALNETKHLKGCFTQIKRTKNKIVFYGRAPSIFDLTTFLTNWDAAKFFSEMQIERMEYQKEGGIRFRFSSIPLKVSGA
jgi:Tfp pilus assembly protein PilN